MRVVRQHRTAVGNADQRGATGTQALVERGFVGAVERAGGFVQDDHGRPVHQRCHMERSAPSNPSVINAGWPIAESSIRERMLERNTAK